MKNNTGLLNNLSWKFVERFSAQIVTTIVSIILARILDPSDYGLISMVSIFITIANVFVSDGLASALIQKKNADVTDFSSFLYFNILISVGLYIILFISAPLIAKFYGKGYEILVPILRVLGLRLILSAINSVQNAYVAKKMIFKQSFFATIIGVIASAVVGILMAYNGYGVWSLVAQYLVSTGISTVMLVFTIKKLPEVKFSFKRVKSLLGYGTKILGSGLLIVGFQEIRALIVGKIYSSADLAYYDKGRQFPNLIVANINTSISSVLFPKMSNEQDDLTKVKYTTRSSIRIGSFIMGPMMLGLAAVANTFVAVILTEKWLSCVPLLQLFCLVYFFQPLHTANMQAVKALGRSDITFWLEVFKKVIELIVLLITMWISVEAIVIGMVGCTIFFTFVNAIPNIKLLNYTIKEQMMDILPSTVCSLVMAVIVWLLNYLPINSLLLLAIQVVVGIAIYFIMAIITKSKEFQFFIDLLKTKILKKKKV